MAEPIPAGAAITLERLRPRRECIEGARSTLQTVRVTLEHADGLDLAREALVPQVAERLALLDLALRQWDQALAGKEPETT